MKKAFFILTLFLFVSNVCAAQEQGQITLKQAYDFAVKQSENISITDEYIRQAEAQYGQALGSVLPEIYFGYDSTWQDRPASAGATPGTFFITPQTNTKFGARKSMLTGYRELAAIQSGSSYVNQRKEEKNRALQLLFADVANAFYGTLQAEADLNVAKKNFGILQDRLSETKQRVRVGRNRGAEVAALESQVSTLEAQSLESERLAQAQRDLLSFLVGRPVNEALVQLQNNMEMRSLSDFMSHVDQRPDVKSQEEAVEVALAKVRIERSKHFPNLGLAGNYYLDRTGFRQDVDWDASLVLEIPIWSWGATQKGVNVAKAEVNVQQLMARQVKRKAELDIQMAYRDATSAQQQKVVYEKASAAAEKEHDLSVRDYRSGLISTFDVLETVNRLNQAERGFNLATLRARLTEVNLKIAAGYTPEEILQ